MIRYGELKISLASPILYPTTRPWFGVTLDGLMGWIWARDKGLCKTPAEEKKESVLFPELPLLQEEPMLYAASTMFLPEKGEEGAELVGCTPEIINKMADWSKPMRAQIRRGMKDMKLVTSSGAYRASLERYWALHTPFIKFYFATEDWDGAESYLKRIAGECFGIGAKARAGYGAIRSAEWREIPEAASFHLQKDGLPTRPIPADGKYAGKFPDELVGECSWRAPYSSPFFRKECYQPPASQYLPKIPLGNGALRGRLADALSEQKKIAETFTKGKKGKKDVA